MTASSALSIEQSGNRSVGRIGACQHVCRRCTDLLRIAIGLARQVHDPRVTFRNQVIAGPIAARAMQSEAGNSDIDKVLTQRLARRCIDREFLQYPRRLIDHDYVAPFDNCSERRPPARRRVVESDAALIAVDRHKPERFAVDERRAPGASIVASSRPLDLDDVGTHVAEQHGTVWTRDRARQVKDPDAVEQIEAKAQSADRQRVNTLGRCS